MSFAFTIVLLCLLEVEELKHAHAIHLDDSAPFEESLVMQPERRIPDICGGLISINKSITRSIHLSLKKYLTWLEEEWIRSDDSKIILFQVDLEAMHLSLSCICVDYLRMCSCDSSLSEQNDILEFGIHSSLLKYTSLYVFSHINQSAPFCLNIIQILKTEQESLESTIRAVSNF